MRTVGNRFWGRDALPYLPRCSGQIGAGAAQSRAPVRVWRGRRWRRVVHLGLTRNADTHCHVATLEQSCRPSRSAPTRSGWFSVHLTALRVCHLRPHAARPRVLLTGSAGSGTVVLIALQMCSQSRPMVDRWISPRIRRMCPTRSPIQTPRCHSTRSISTLYVLT